jgi:hypothetical protein
MIVYYILHWGIVIWKLGFHGYAKWVISYLGTQISQSLYLYMCIGVVDYHVDDLRYVASIFFYYYNDVNIF